MEILFLGTSSGAPTKMRNVAGAAIKKVNSKSWYLVDCGEGTQHKILKSKLSINKLKAVFITHVHGDHCFGLPGLIASATMSGRKSPLLIVGPKEVQEWIEYTSTYSQMRFTYELQFIDVETLKDNPLALDHFDIDVTELSHRVPSYAYGFTENNIKPQLDTKKLAQDGIAPGPLWGKLQKLQDVTLQSGETLNCNDYLLPKPEPRKAIIAGDNDQPELLAKSAKTANVMVHESTYTQAISDRIGPHPQHSTAKAVAEFAESVGLEHLILTHFSARYQDAETGDGSIIEIENEAKQYYSGNIYLAEDDARFELNQECELEQHRHRNQ